MGNFRRRSNNPSTYFWIWTLAKGIIVLYTVWLWITGILVIFRTRDTANTITNPDTLLWEVLAGFAASAIIYAGHWIFTRGMSLAQRMGWVYIYRLFMFKCMLMYALLFVLFAVFKWDYCDDVDCKMLTSQTSPIGDPEKDIHDRLLTYKLLCTILVVLSTSLLLSVFDKFYYGYMFGKFVQRDPSKKPTETKLDLLS